MRSITQKLVAISIVFILLSVIYIVRDIDAIRRAKSEALRINFTAQLKSHSYEMAWLSRRLAERDAEKPDGSERKALSGRLRDEIGDFDRIIEDLRNGNRSAGLEKLEYGEALTLLDGVRDAWSGELKSMLLRISGLLQDAAEADAGELPGAFDRSLGALSGRVDRLADYLNNYYYAELEEYERFRLFIVGLLVVMTAVIVWYVRQGIVAPVKTLGEAARKIAKGDYAVHLDMRRGDEIGDLAGAFNRMSEALAHSFEDQRRNAEQIMALNKASNTIIGLLKADELYKTICDSACEVFDLKVTWLGLVSENDREVKVVAQSGLDSGEISRIRVSWDDSASGMGLAGMAIKTNSAQILNDALNAEVMYPLHDEAERRGYRSVMAMPMICANCAVIGVLSLYSGRRDYFSPRMVELCRIFANQAASAIESATLLQDLETRVKERTQALEDAKLVAESANMSKSAFLSNMSHDLRTPLNAIIGFSEALSQGIYGELRPDHREYLDYIYQSGLKLLKLIDEVLDLSRIESGGMQLHYNECLITDILHNALYVFGEKMKKHGIALHMEVADDARMLDVDDGKIKQVLIILLTDAIRSMPEGGSICIRAESVSRSDAMVSPASGGRVTGETQSEGTDGECVRISLTDTRPGIGGGDRAMFFEPYPQQAAAGNKKPDVGMLLCRRFVELHGGRIWAEPPAGPACGEDGNEGNSFILVLPRHPRHVTLR